MRWRPISMLEGSGAERGWEDACKDQDEQSCGKLLRRRDGEVCRCTLARYTCDRTRAGTSHKISFDPEPDSQLSRVISQTSSASASKQARKRRRRVQAHTRRLGCERAWPSAPALARFRIQQPLYGLVNVLVLPPASFFRLPVWGRSNFDPLSARGRRLEVSWLLTYSRRTQALPCF